MLKMSLTDEKTQSLLKSIISDAVIALCRNTLCFSQQLTIDGLLGIVTDSNAHLMIHIKHCQKSQDEEQKEREEQSASDRQKSQQRLSSKKRRNRDNSPTVVPSKPIIEIKHEVLSDTDDIQLLEEIDIKQAEITSTPENAPPYSKLAKVHDLTMEFQPHYNETKVPENGLFEQTEINLTDNFLTQGSNVSHLETSVQQQTFESNGQHPGFDLATLPPDSLTCPLCFKTLGSFSSLSRHMKCHGAAQLSCPICTKPFNRRDNLKRHVDKVHNHMNVGDDLVNVTQEEQSGNEFSVT